MIKSAYSYGTSILKRHRTRGTDCTEPGEPAAQCTLKGTQKNFREETPTESPSTRPRLTLSTFTIIHSHVGRCQEEIRPTCPSTAFGERSGGVRVLGLVFCISIAMCISIASISGKYCTAKEAWMCSLFSPIQIIYYYYSSVYNNQTPEG